MSHVEIIVGPSAAAVTVQCDRGGPAPPQIPRDGTTLNSLGPASTPRPGSQVPAAGNQLKVSGFLFALARSPPPVLWPHEGAREPHIFVAMRAARFGSIQRVLAAAASRPPSVSCGAADGTTSNRVCSVARFPNQSRDASGPFRSAGLSPSLISGASPHAGSLQRCSVIDRVPGRAIRVRRTRVSNRPTCNPPCRRPRQQSDSFYPPFLSRRGRYPAERAHWTMRRAGLRL